MNKKNKHSFRAGFKKSIAVVQEAGGGIPGPLWVRGGIPAISSDEGLPVKSGTGNAL
jgi:hypothetical protein